jgi:Tol biopolymer transport system component
MATLVHAPVVQHPVRPWSPLRIGVVWALATAGGALAGIGLGLLWARSVPSYTGENANFATDVIDGLFVMAGIAILGLIGLAVAQALLLGRFYGPAGWDAGIALAWMFATLGGGVIGLVLGVITCGSGLLVFGACIGGAQGLVLRRYMPRVDLWVAATTAGWWGGALAFVMLQYAEIVAVGVGLIVVGLLNGAAGAMLLNPVPGAQKRRWQAAISLIGILLLILAALELLILPAMSRALGQEVAQVTLRHQGAFVVSAAYSPDGKTIVTANSGTAKIWDATTGQEVRTLRGHGGEVKSAAYSPDGKTIVTGSQDGTAKIWDAATGQELRTLGGHPFVVDNAAYNPDGTTIVTAGYDRTAKTYEAKIWDAATGQELRTLASHRDTVNSVAYSPDGKTILTASDDGSATMWDVATGRRLRAPGGYPSGVRSAAYSPDGKTIAAASGENARIFDAATGQLLHTLTGHNATVLSVAYSPDGKTIVTASQDHTAKIWDTATGQVLRTLVGHGEFVRSAAYSPDGKSIVTASDDGTARIWRAGP